MTWEIFLGIVALVGFIISVTTPLMKLNTSITKLNNSVDVLKSAIDRIDTENEESHKRIWKHNDEQDEIIAEHSRKINNIEHTMIMTERLHPELAGLHSQLNQDS
jgi:cell division protein FtsL